MDLRSAPGVGAFITRARQKKAVSILEEPCALRPVEKKKTENEDREEKVEADLEAWLGRDVTVRWETAVLPFWGY